MKKFTRSLRMRVAIAAALCLGFVLYSPLRISVHAVAELKTESQYRSEASRYDAAIRAISGIATMKLDTPDNLSKAVAIAERERPNLKLRFSRFVVTGLNDSTFVNAVKKKMPTKEAADAFNKELSADRNAILKLDGAESLKTQIVRSAEADAALLNRVGLLLKEAGEKIKKTAQGNDKFKQWPIEGFKVVRAGFALSEEPTDSLAPSALEPLSASAAVAIAVVVSIVAGFVIGYLQHDLITVQDDEEACLEKADEDYRSCMTAANGLPRGFPLFLRESARAICIGKSFLDVGACHLLR